MSLEIQIKAFTLVEFSLDNGVEVVPSTWISDDGATCKFPHPIPRGFSRIQRDANSFPDPDWTIYVVKCIASYGN